MRTAAVVALLSALAALLLAATAPELPATTGRVTALTLPADVLVGEAVAVRGSVSLPSEGVLDRRFRVCHLELDRCVTTGWGSVPGPGHWTGYAGQVAANDPGTYRVTWTLHAPWGGDTTRAAARTEAEVTVRAPAD